MIQQEKDVKDRMIDELKAIVDSNKETLGKQQRKIESFDTEMLDYKKQITNL